MVRKCIQKHTGLEFAAKIINTKKLSARGKCTVFIRSLHFYVLSRRAPSHSRGNGGVYWLSFNGRDSDGSILFERPRKRSHTWTDTLRVCMYTLCALTGSTAVSPEAISREPGRVTGQQIRVPVDDVVPPPLENPFASVIGPDDDSNGTRRVRRVSVYYSTSSTKKYKIKGVEIRLRNRTICRVRADAYIRSYLWKI